ncbi:MAG TPA: hydantoinase/oxoprolinase family protein [Candidatus Saccharimonadia bacterium]|nr:hydantoinase/oxoprolinase family protein [Candidatus Saccharimonadia bacterium]
MKLIGVDVGGTFTDIVCTDTETRHTIIHKSPTTPDDPSHGVITGVSELCARFGLLRGDIDHVLHGTTIATNAVLEYNGAVTGMVTSAGYRDILHIGRHQRPQHYSIMQDIPWQDRPLVRRRFRKTVPERLMPPHGDVLIPLDEAAVRQAARELKAAGVEAIAVCFLFSYLDSTHEERARAIIMEEYPHCFVTTSASVAPQFREFERFTTTAMNAFIGPKVRNYVQQLAGALQTAGFKADLHVMGSNGGVATAKMVAERPVLTLLSGPAAGVLGGAWSGALSHKSHLITFDMGGTSADIGLIVDGTFAEATARDTWIGGYPIMAPMIDIHTIGAGGGSIAYVDAGGAFRVGPHSAGAQPGPAAYGKGGDQPTVTDAHVVLGHLDPDYFLGGAMTLDVEAAQRVIGALGDTLDMSFEDTAAGVLTIVNANMANAIRSRTVQKGLDPRNFSLVAFGGAGPLHGVEVARALGIPEVIVPRYPGITSAIGLLTTDLKYDTIKTAFMTSGSVDYARLNADFAAMQAQLITQYQADGIPENDVTFAWAGDLRYVGQGYELRVPFPSGTLDSTAIAQVFAAFQGLHKAEYGHVFAHSPIEIVNIRLTGIGVMPKIAPPQVSGHGALSDALVKTAPCVFRLNGELARVETPFYQRERLAVGATFAGPAVILQQDTTTVAPPGTRLVIDAGGNVIIHVGS